MARLNTMDKKELRKQIKALKKQHTAEQLETQSKAIMAKVESHPDFAKANIVMLSYSLPDEGHASQCLDGGLGINLRFAVAQRARTAQEMLALWGKEGIAIEEPQEAIHYALEHAAPEDAVFIGGSNYLVAEVLQ